MFPLILFVDKLLAVIYEKSLCAISHQTKSLPPSKGRCCAVHLPSKASPPARGGVAQCTFHQKPPSQQREFLRSAPQKKAPLCKGGCQQSVAMLTGGLLYYCFEESANRQHVQTIPLSHLRCATSPCTGEAWDTVEACSCPPLGATERIT